MRRLDDGHAISQQKRKLIELGFAWARFISPIRQVFSPEMPLQPA